METREVESGAIIIIIIIMELLHISRDLQDLVEEAVTELIIHILNLSLVSNLTILHPSNTIAIKC